MKSRSMGIFFLVSGLALAYAPAAKGQVALTGEIAGLVMDANGEGLPGVAVTLKGEKLFQRFLTVVTNDKGAFRFLELEPGRIRAGVCASGFRHREAARRRLRRQGRRSARPHDAGRPQQRNHRQSRAPPLIETRDGPASTNYSERPHSADPDLAQHPGPHGGDALIKRRRR